MADKNRAQGKSKKALTKKAKLKKKEVKSWVKLETGKWNASANSKCRRLKKSCERAGAEEAMSSFKSQRRKSQNRSEMGYLGGSSFFPDFSRIAFGNF
jgi:hypothetical protein